MAIVRLGFPNLLGYSDLAAPDGAWIPALPLSNLQDPLISNVARSANLDPANTQFTISFHRQRDINIVVLVGHNLSADATFTVQASTVADWSSYAYNAAGTSTPAYPSGQSTYDASWGDDSWWSGRPSLEDLDGLTLNSILVLPSTVTARYWKIAINDPNNTDGHVDLGRVFISPQWQPAFNYGFGAQLGFVDLSTSERSLGGSIFFDRRAVYRTATFGFTNLPELQSFTNLFDLIRQAGMTQETFYIPDSDDVQNIQRRSFLASVKELSTLEQAAFQSINAQFQLQELI